MHARQRREYIHHLPFIEFLWTLSPQAIFRSFSPHLTRETGWSESDWLGKPLQTFLRHSDMRRLQERFEEIISGDTIELEEVHCLTKSGEYGAWTLSFVPRRTAGILEEIVVLGHTSNESSETAFPPIVHPLSALGIYRDTEHTPFSMVAGLAKLLEGILGNAPVGFALLDEAMRFVCLNQKFSEMTGFSPAQQLGQPLRDLLPVVARRLDPVLQNVLNTGEPEIDYELEIPKSSQFATDRHVQLSFYPIPDLHGGTCGVALVALDISARKQSEAKRKLVSDELARSNQALEAFSYVASHDLKEPLRTISNFARLLGPSCEGKLNDQGNEYLSFVVEGTQRMQRLVDKLLEYSRAGRANGALVSIDCTALMKTTLSNLRVCLEESGGSVTYDPLPVVLSDETLLAQVFQNLVSNAVKYRRAEPPAIHVTAERQLSSWVFTFSDNGIGISRDHFLDVFTPFRKLHSESEYAGAGLGLSICQKNIERLGGRIWVNSQEGKGSKFSFTLPAPTGGKPENENAERIK